VTSCNRPVVATHHRCGLEFHTLASKAATKRDDEIEEALFEEDAA
jgi:hypothetical protein